MAKMMLTNISVPGGSNVAGSNAVLAGIAAADAICGYTLGRRAAGESHHEAIALLERAVPSGSRAPANLKRLLASKTDTQYSANMVSDSKARDLVTAAERLVEEMDKLLQS